MYTVTTHALCLSIDEKHVEQMLTLIPISQMKLIYLLLKHTDHGYQHEHKNTDHSQ